MNLENRIKTRQGIITIAAIVSVIGLVILGLYLSDPSRKITESVTEQEEVVNNYRTAAKAMEPSEIWIAKSESEMNELKRSNQDLQHRLETLTKELERMREQSRKEQGLPSSSRNTLPIPPPPPPPQKAAVEVPSAGTGDRNKEVVQKLLPPPPALQRNGSGAGGGRPGAGNAGEAPQQGILSVSLARGAGKAARAGKDGSGSSGEKHIRSFIPAGSFAKGILLSGLDAPTGGLAKTNPQPVLLELQTPGTLPNRFRSRIKRCFVTAAGYGDLGSERAYLRLETLSCVMRDGGVLEKTISGYVAGEDGKAGMRGRVVSKQGQMIGRALIAGIAGGIGDGLAKSMTSLSTSALGTVATVNSEDIAKVGLASGFSNALEKIADWYIDRANEMYPVIEVDSARRVDVVLTKGLDLGLDLFDRAASGERG